MCLNKKSASLKHKAFNCNQSSQHEWKSILAPYIQIRHCDSYEAHKSDTIRCFIPQKYRNIHCCVIPESYTDILQPLDMGINTELKVLYVVPNKLRHFFNSIPKSVVLEKSRTQQYIGYEVV